MTDMNSGEFTSRPLAFDIVLNKNTLSTFDEHLQRRLSAMRGQYAGESAYEAMLAEEDTILYQVYHVTGPESSGELPSGLTIVHAGRVGDEYFMTKGHFHAVLETGEVYVCLRGEGMIVMENPEGAWAVEPMQPGRVVYIPPRWAHRSVNTSDSEDFVFFFVYPGHAGHDYGTIEERGFRKLIVKGAKGPQIVDNPRWER